jgi:pilus assembly protein CpaC
MNRSQEIKKTNTLKSGTTKECVGKFLVLLLMGSFLFEGALTFTAFAAKKSKFHRSRLTRDETEGVADRRTLVLSAGEDKVVDLDFDIADKDHVSIGNPQIVTTQTIGIDGQRRQLVFKPLKAGETNVTIRNPDTKAIEVIFHVIVSGSNILRRKAEMMDLLKDIEGIDIRVVGQKVVIDGEVLVPADYGRIVSVIMDKSYADIVLNLATLSPLALQILAKKIQEDVVTFAPNVKTRVVNGVIFLEGTVDNKDQADRALTVAKYYLPEVRLKHPLVKDPTAEPFDRKPVFSFIVINPPPDKKQEKLVRVTFHFVELSKDYLRNFGFKWEPGFTSDGAQINIGRSPDGAVGGQGATFTATIASLFPALKAMQNAGYARVLKSGTIVVRSGQPGELNDSIEYAYTTLGQNGQAPTVGKSEVGFNVGVTPKILGQSEDIQMDIKFVQRSLAGKAPAPGSAPTTSVHSVNTKLYVKNNESAAIAGVQTSAVLTDFNKDDPRAGTHEGGEPLFTLKRTKEYSKKKAQFVVFVTPQIIENASEGTEDLKKNFRVKAN